MKQIFKIATGIGLALALFVRKRRDDDRAQHAANQHQCAERACICGREPARADDIFHPGGDAVENSHADKRYE